MPKMAFNFYEMDPWSKLSSKQFNFSGHKMELF